MSRRPGGGLDERLRALDAAITAGHGVVEEERLAPARAIVARAGGRLGHGVERTVVALAGATGSGKSSLFNALVGETVSTVGVRRPTTSRTSGAAWGSGADALLDWLEVPSRHLVAAAPGDPLHGLVLLDLPDHDSTAAAHRAEADRVVAVADLVVWVLDPQKYADAAVHEGYLRPLASHGEVLLVVLNQADRLDEPGLAACRADLRRLLADDGLPRLEVVATSTVTGAGIPELREELVRRVRDRRAAVDRLTADVTAAASALSADCAGGPARASGGSRDRVVDALAEVAGVPAVTRAVAASFRARGARRVGWPITRWVGRLRPDPLRRLHLQREGGSTARTSLPPPSGVALARFRTTVRDVADGTAGELPPSWASALHDDAGAAMDEVLPRLDATVAGTELDARRDPRWWTLAAGLQWLLAATALVGAVWLGVLAVLGYLQLQSLDPPDVGRVPLPTALLLGGLLAGMLLAGMGRWVVGIGAGRRARRADRRLRREVGALADEAILGRVDDLAARHAAFCEALRVAGARS